MRYIRDGICTGHRRRRECISVPAGKKDTKIFNQSIACTNAEIEWGRGEKVFFPNKRYKNKSGRLARYK